MTIKERLIQDIDTMPEDLLAQLLDFSDFIKAKREMQKNSPELQESLPYRPASGRSILRHAGTWQGDDFEACLQMVYDTRSKANFDRQAI